MELEATAERSDPRCCMSGMAESVAQLATVKVVALLPTTRQAAGEVQGLALRLQELFGGVRIVALISNVSRCCM